MNTIRIQTKERQAICLTSIIAKTQNSIQMRGEFSGEWELSGQYAFKLYNRTYGNDKFENEYMLANRIRRTICANDYEKNVNVVLELSQVLTVADVSFTNKNDKEIFEDYIYPDSKIGVSQLVKNGYFLSEFFKNELLGELSVPKKIEIGKKILVAANTLFCNGFLHLDLHPGNIFLEGFEIGKDKEYNIYFIDFSNAINQDDKKESYLVTAGFSAEELSINYNGLRNVDVQSDIYSIGKIIYSMLLEDIISGPYNEAYTKEWLKKENGFCTLTDNLLLRFFNATLKERKSSYFDIIDLINKAEDDMDLIYSGDIYTLLSNRYIRKEEFSVEWCSAAINLLVMNDKGIESCLLNACLDLYNGIQNERNYDSQKGYAIYSTLEKLDENYCMEEKKCNSSLYKYWLLKDGVSIMNNIGATEKAKLLHDKLDEAGKLLKIDTKNKYNDKNRLIVTCWDGLDYEKAKKMGCETEREVSAFIKFCEDNDFSDAEINEEVACLLSTLGQNEVFLEMSKKNPDNGKRNEVYNYFEKAIRYFRKDDDLNIIKTKTHYMQAAISFRDLDKYNLIANSIRSDKKISFFANNPDDAYVLFALLKGIYVFGDDCANYNCDACELMDTYKCLEDMHKNKISDENRKVQHPYQLVYKYLGLLLHRYYDESDKDVIVDKCFNNVRNICDSYNFKSSDIDQKFDIFKAMEYQSMAEYLRIHRDETKIKELIMDFKKMVKEERFNFMVDSKGVLMMKDKEVFDYICKLCVHEYS